jgi:hypothetical protein
MVPKPSHYLDGGRSDLDTDDMYDWQFHAVWGQGGF